MQQLKPGTKLNTTYTIVRLLGQGGFAFTYEAVQEPLGRKVCIKELFLAEKMTRDAEKTTEVSWKHPVDEEETVKYKADFMEEGRILGTIDDPSVEKVIGYFEENRTSYMVLEYLEGMTLKDYVRDNGPVPSETLFASVLPLLKGLSTLHDRHLIHRDIAPDNLMIMPETEEDRANHRLKLKLFDFGTVRESGKTDYTCVLKDGYTPIEQVAGTGTQGPATDLYALCATLWYGLVGEKPDGACSRLLDDGLKRPSQMGIAIDPVLEDILMKGLAIQPEDRFQSAEEMCTAIQNAMQPVQQETSTIGKQKKNRTGKKIRYAVCAILAVLLLGAGIFSAVGTREMKYDPTKMYKITLTPDDTFTVAGYNDSLKILKERLDIFAANSHRYRLREDGGTVELLLNKEDFPMEKEKKSERAGVETETASIPEYVLRAYLTRACALVLRNTETKETIPVNQTEDLVVTAADGLLPEDALTDTGTDGTAHRYIRAVFSEAFLQKNRTVLAAWNGKYQLCQDVDYTPVLTPFTTFPMKDGSGFYLMDKDDGEFVDLLVYNLTHSALEHSFLIDIEEQVDWQKDGTAYGQHQVSENSLAKESGDITECYLYGMMTEGELADCYQALRARLDAFDSPYALGRMDSLTAVTAGADAPVYTFIGVKMKADSIQYTDLLDLVMNSSQFYLCTESGEQTELWGTEVTADTSGIKLQIPDAYRGSRLYLVCTDDSGGNRQILMQSEEHTGGEVVFTEFADGTAVGESNGTVVNAIVACMKNRLPVDLLPYEVKLQNGEALTEETSGLFISENV